jgi:hypothetical protein
MSVMMQKLLLKKAPDLNGARIQRQLWQLDQVVEFAADQTKNRIKEHKEKLEKETNTKLEELARINECGF